jgi:hypothetical protein
MTQRLFFRLTIWSTVKAMLTIVAAIPKTKLAIDKLFCMLFHLILSFWISHGSRYNGLPPKTHGFLSAVQHLIPTATLYHFCKDWKSFQAKISVNSACTRLTDFTGAA